MAEIHRIPKRGRNEHFKYDYVMEADLVEAVRGLLAARHVMLVPSIKSVAKDGRLTTTLMTFTFHDGETGECLTIPWAGCGDDPADKGLAKSITGAVKYVIAKTFLIPTGDDPEADDQSQSPRKSVPAKQQPQGTPQTSPTASPLPGPPTVVPGSVTIGKISEAQRKRYYAVAKEHGWTKPEAAALIKRVLGVDSSADIPTHRYKEIVKMLEAGVDSMANG